MGKSLPRIRGGLFPSSLGSHHPVPRSQEMSGKTGIHILGAEAPDSGRRTWSSFAHRRTACALPWCATSAPDRRTAIPTPPPHCPPRHPLLPRFPAPGACPCKAVHTPPRVAHASMRYRPGHRHAHMHGRARSLERRALGGQVPRSRVHVPHSVPRNMCCRALRRTAYPAQNGLPR